MHVPLVLSRPLFLTQVSRTNSSSQQDRVRFFRPPACLCLSQALAALKKYRATVQRRGRDAIDNRCGYLIGFLKQYQDGVAVVGVSNSNNFSNQQGSSRGAPSSTFTSNGDHAVPPPKSANQTASSSHGHSTTNGSRVGPGNGTGGVSAGPGGETAKQQVSGQAPSVSSVGGTSGVRPISYLQEPVRKQLEKLFESGKDKAVLEDVGLIKQLARLGEEQALAALKNYKEASKHRRDIHNKSAYLMGILRGYIEGTTPISKAPWEAAGAGGSSNGSGNGSGSDDGPESSMVTQPAPNGAGPSQSRVGRGDIRGPGGVTDDSERSVAGSVLNLPSDAQQQPPPPPQPLPPTRPLTPSLEVPGPREFGGFANAPPVSLPPPPSLHQQQQTVLPHAALPIPVSGPPSTTSSLASPPLGGGGLFLGVGLGNSNSSIIGDLPQQGYDPSKGLLYMNGNGNGAPGGGSGFGIAPSPTPPAHQPPRHSSPHESLFGHARVGGGDAAQQQHQHQTLVGPGLLGGEFLANGGGSDRGLGHSLTSSSGAGGGGGSSSISGSPSNPVGVLFGSGLLAGDELGAFGNGNGNVPASPGSASALGSTFGSTSLSGAGSPFGSEGGGHDPTMMPMSSAAVTAAGFSSVDVASPAVAAVSNSSGNGSSSHSSGHEHGLAADWRLNNSSVSPRSGSTGRQEGGENVNYSDSTVGGMVDMLARLNLSKYVPVLAEAEVDMDALRLFGEVCGLFVSTPFPGPACGAFLVIRECVESGG